MYIQGALMEVSIKELRTQPGHYIRLAEAGAEVVITSHGARKARIVPVQALQTAPGSKPSDAPGEKPGFLFGMWADRVDMDDVGAYLESMRKERSF